MALGSRSGLSLDRVVPTRRSTPKQGKICRDAPAPKRVKSNWLSTISAIIDCSILPIRRQKCARTTSVAARCFSAVWGQATLIARRRPITRLQGPQFVPMPLRTTPPTTMLSISARVRSQILNADALGKISYGKCSTTATQIHKRQAPLMAIRHFVFSRRLYSGQELQNVHEDARHLSFCLYNHRNCPFAAGSGLRSRH